MAKSSKNPGRNSKGPEAAPCNAGHLSATRHGWLSFSCLALFFLLYVALPSGLLSTFLLTRIGTPQLAYWLSLVLLGGVIVSYRNRLRIADYLVFFGLMLACHVYAYYSIDLSTDGLAYHQPAIRRIANGFNPVYDGYMNLGRAPDIWSDQATYFSKALWYFSAAATAAFGDIQISKVYTPLLIFAALFFVLDATKKEPFAQRVLWGMACLNPIALTQIPSTLVDGALSSLITLSLCYAYLFFTGAPITRIQHAVCLVALAMLFCVKASGFGYGCIVLFFIVLHRLAATYRHEAARPRLARLAAAGKATVQQVLRLGVPVFFLVFIWGFAPYATNLLDSKHIFHPLINDGSERSGHVLTDAEKGARAVYPDADTRVMRLLRSIASHTTLDNTQAATLKSPLDISLADWTAFGQSYHVRAAGLGPLFYLVFLLSVAAPLFFRLRSNGWLLCTLMALLFMQPYSWLMRFAPFLWMLPLVCLMSLPDHRKGLLWLPLSLAAINVLGVSYVAVTTAWGHSRNIQKISSHFAGEVVMLPRTIYEYAGAFDRYGIREKYINPEDTDLAMHAQGVGWGLLAGPRLPNGVNVFLQRDLVPLPETTLAFAETAALPWLRMSDGLVPLGGQNGFRNATWVSTGNKVKFYMALQTEPKGDWEITLHGSMFDTRRTAGQTLDVLLSVNNHTIGTWHIEAHDSNTRSATFSVPQAILEESVRDETRLVTLMLRLQGVPSFPGQRPPCGIQLEGLRIRPERVHNRTLPPSRQRPDAMQLYGR